MSNEINKAVRGFRGIDSRNKSSCPKNSQPLLIGKLGFPTSEFSRGIWVHVRANQLLENTREFYSHMEWFGKSNSRPRLFFTGDRQRLCGNRACQDTVPHLNIGGYYVVDITVFSPRYVCRMANFSSECKINLTRSPSLYTVWPTGYTLKQTPSPHTQTVSFAS